MVTDGFMSPDGTGKIVGIQCIPDQQSVCVATDNGNLLVWNIIGGEVCIQCRK